MRILYSFVLVMLFSGCLCCGGIGGPDKIPSNYVDETYIPPTTTSTIPKTTSTIPTTTQTQVKTTSSTSSTYPITTTTTIAFSKSDFSISLAGCDDDYYGNAMVAGYIQNNGPSPATVMLVTELQDASGVPITDGIKRKYVKVESNSQLKFSQTYTQPLKWKKCRAYIE